MELLRGLGVLMLLLAGVAHYLTVNAGCKPCFCNGNIMRCVGITIHTIPHMDNDGKEAIKIVVLKGTSINKLDLDEVENLQEVFSFKNDRLTCSTLKEFQNNYPAVKIHSDCQIDSSNDPSTPPSTPTSTRPSTPPSTPSSTQDTEPGKKKTPDFDIAFSTNGVTVNIIVPNTTTLENTTIALEYGKSKLKIVTSSTLAICSVVICCLIGLLCWWCRKRRRNDPGEPVRIRAAGVELTIQEQNVDQAAGGSQTNRTGGGNINQAASGSVSSVSLSSGSEHELFANETVADRVKKRHSKSKHN